MTEAIRNNITYYLIFFVPIVMYLSFSKALGKAFAKLPDDPSYTEKSGKQPNFFVRILKRLGGIALVVVLAFGIASFKRDSISKAFEDGDTRREAIVAEYEALHEENVDAQNGKTILTEAFLQKEYKLYASSEQSGSDFATTIYKFLFISILFTIGGASCIDYVIGFYRIKKKINFLSIFATVLLVPTIILGFRAIDDLFGTSKMPDPENATVSVIPVTVSSRYEDVIHDDENGDTYKYYITIDYGDGNGPVKKKVSYGFYYNAENPGVYLLGLAKEGDKEEEFELYSSEEYEPEK